MIPNGKENNGFRSRYINDDDGDDDDDDDRVLLLLLFLFLLPLSLFLLWLITSSSSSLRFRRLIAIRRSANAEIGFTAASFSLLLWLRLLRDELDDGSGQNTDDLIVTSI